MDNPSIIVLWQPEPRDSIREVTVLTIDGCLKLERDAVVTPPRYEGAHRMFQAGMSWAKSTAAKETGG